MDKFKQTVRMVWAAMFAALGIYAFVLYRTAASAPPDAPAWAFSADPLTLAMGALAAVGALASILAPPWFLAQGAAARTRPDWQPPPANPQMPDIAPELQQLIPVIMMGFVFAELPAVAGLVLGFTHHSLAPYLPFGGLAAVLMALQYPSSDRIETKLRTLRGG